MHRNIKQQIVQKAPKQVRHTNMRSPRTLKQTRHLKYIYIYIYIYKAIELSLGSVTIVLAGLQDLSSRGCSLYSFVCLDFLVYSLEIKLFQIRPRAVLNQVPP